MFKGFSNSRRNNAFNGFPNINFGMNNVAYGYSGCQCWYDAALGLNTSTNLAAVSEWVDRIRGIRFTQGTAGNQPRLLTSDANFNNYPSIDFSVGSRALVNSLGVAGGGIGLNGNNLAIAFVAKNSVVNANLNILFTDQPATSLGFIITGSSSAGITGIGVYDGASANTPVLVTTTEDTATHIVVITNDQIVIDGTQKITGTFIPKIAIDRIGFPNANGFTGQLSEFLVYSNFTSSNAIALCNVINQKYAIY